MLFCTFQSSQSHIVYEELKIFKKQKNLQSIIHDQHKLSIQNISVAAIKLHYFWQSLPYLYKVFYMRFLNRIYPYNISRQHKQTDSLFYTSRLSNGFSTGDGTSYLLSSRIIVSLGKSSICTNKYLYSNSFLSFSLISRCTVPRLMLP